MSKKTYIYESPDGGKTVFKREFGKTEKTQEKIMSYDYKSMVGELMIQAGRLEKILEIIKSEPNDQKLGNKLRQLSWSYDEEKNHNQMNLFGEGDN